MDAGDGDSIGEQRVHRGNWSEEGTSVVRKACQENTSWGGPCWWHHLWHGIIVYHVLCVCTASGDHHPGPRYGCILTAHGECIVKHEHKYLSVLDSLELHAGCGGPGFQRGIRARAVTVVVTNVGAGLHRHGQLWNR